MKLRKKLIIFSILFLFGFGVFFGTFARGGFVNAASDNYVFVGANTQTKTAAVSGEQYEIEVSQYVDLDNNKMKLIFYIGSNDAYIGDYSNFQIILYRTQMNIQTQYSEHLIRDANASQTIEVQRYGTYEDMEAGLLMTFEFDCNLTSLYIAHCYYYNYENDNDIEYYTILWLGYAPPYYENVATTYYNNGYNVGQQDANEARFWFVGLFEGFQRFLDIEIMGISIGTIILVPFAITFVWFIVRQFKGGGD